MVLLKSAQPDPNEKAVPPLDMVAVREVVGYAALGKPSHCLLSQICFTQRSLLLWPASAAVGRARCPAFGKVILEQEMQGTGMQWSVGMAPSVCREGAIHIQIHFSSIIL